MKPANCARFLCVLALALCSPAAFVVAQTPLTKIPVDEKSKALGRVRLLADLIHSMKDDTARVRGLALVGREVCSFDKELSLETFARALQIVQAAESATRASLRRTLLPQIARCDPETVYKLNAAKAEDENDASNTADSATDLFTAAMLRDEDPANASLFLNRALQSGLTEPQMQNAMVTLMGLRARDMAAADATFLSLLARLRAELRPEANHLLLVGNYLFTPPPMPGVPEQYRVEGIMMTTIGAGRPGWVSTWNLADDRPGMNPALVRPYLEAALDILSRPVQDPRQQAADFVALHQLAAKVPRFAPDLAPQFALLRDRLAANVSEMLRRPTSYNILNDPNTGPSIEDRIAAEPNPTKRDEWRLRLLSSASSRNDLARARKLVAEIEDKDLREALSRVLQFFDAAKAISEGKLREAEEIVAPMLTGAKRALLALGLVSAYLQKGERDPATAWLKIAGTEAGLADNPARAPLLLAVAGAAMRLDREAGLAALDSAVNAFNRENRPPPVPQFVAPLERRPPTAEKPTDRAIVQFTTSGFWEEMFHGNYLARFRLAVTGVGTADFTPELLIHTGADAERAQAIVVKLEDESRRATALSSLARAYLESAKMAPQKAAISAVP